MKADTFLDHPFDEHGARAAAAKAARLQAETEGEVREAFRAYGEAEKNYRRALAVKIVELRADGLPATVCADLARGDDDVSELRLKRDVAEGVKEAALQASWRRSADRKDTGRLIDWSAGRDLATGGQDPEDAATGTVFGARRAA